MTGKGNISIHAENMFPIIKKWLYSEKDIFVRELVSNAADAISKLTRLAAIGEAEFDGAGRITVRVDSEAGTLAIEDNGLGMTADEIGKYINEVAFSGAQDFFEKYKDAGADAQIIGHFGLGFYSAFMAGKRVTIDTLSFRPGVQSAFWESEDGISYEMREGTRTQRGTVITVWLDDESREFADKWRVREVLTKYFRFLPGQIFVEDVKDPAPDAGAESEAPKPVNNPDPLWNKLPKDCTDEEYRAFYHEVFMDTNDPLFWVHLNIDYPFRLKGILYFPKLRHELESIEGQVKLYCNQVFVADNLKEVIPEYLLLLKGCIDCPDLPLNVSRSFLQNDGTVTRLSAHITKKVGDRLLSLYNNERETYDKYWDDLNPFIKYGCLRDEKFYERVKGALLFKTLDGAYKTVDEYLALLPDAPAADKADCTDPNCDHASCGEAAKEDGDAAAKEPKTVYYVSDEKQQAQYVSMYRANGLHAVVLGQVLDNHFVSFLEYKRGDIRFRRIDADVDGLTGAQDGEAPAIDQEALRTLFGDAAQDTEISFAALKDGASPAVLVLSEEGRRMQEMSRMFGGQPGMEHMFKEKMTLVVNKRHPLIATISALTPDRAEDAQLLAAQVVDLARIAQQPLDAQAMTAFIERSAKIMALAAGAEG